MGQLRASGMTPGLAGTRSVYTVHLDDQFAALCAVDLVQAGGSAPSGSGQAWTASRELNWSA
jgi:hypothetical protein